MAMSLRAMDAAIKPQHDGLGLTVTLRHDRRVSHGNAFVLNGRCRQVAA